MQELNSPAEAPDMEIWPREPASGPAGAAADVRNSFAADAAASTEDAEECPVSELLTRRAIAQACVQNALQLDNPQEAALGIMAADLSGLAMEYALAIKAGLAADELSLEMYEQTPHLRQFGKLSQQTHQLVQLCEKLKQARTQDPLLTHSPRDWPR